MGKPTYIDLFAGAGGLSEGFIQGGFLPIAHVEQDASACLTLQTRLAYHHLKQSGRLSTYISYLKREITRDQLYEGVPKELLQSVVNECISARTLAGIFAEIDNLRGKKAVDIIIGGPPCQAYSTTGRVAHVKSNPPKKLAIPDFMAS